MRSMDIAQVALSIWGAIFAGIASVAVFLGRKNDPKRSALLAELLVVDAIMLLSDAATIGYDMEPGAAAEFITRVGSFFVFACIPALAVIMMFYVYALTTVPEHTPNRKWLIAMCVLAGIHMVLVAITPLTGFLYGYDENNLYHRGPGFLSASVLGALELMLIAALLLSHKSTVSHAEKLSVMGFLLVPFLTNIFQTVNYGLNLNDLAITVSLFLIFLTHEVKRSTKLTQTENATLAYQVILSEQRAEIAKKDAELAQKQLQISVSQMQPHFAFNALGSIEQLCLTDPKKAAQATHHFAQYLRRNLRTLASTDLTTFDSEIEHVRTYVWLEKMRFGDDVSLREELQVTDFRLPSLTVQPLVENAIKHGMMGSEEGTLHIILRSQELPNAYLIQVIDDGCGFDTAKEVTVPGNHVGLNNVKERIHVMVGGTVQVFSRENLGTIVEIRIPK